MKETRNILMTVFWLGVCMAALWVLLSETGVIETGMWAGQFANAEFVTTTMMELMTIAAIPLALKMFKMKRIHGNLVEGKALALRKWGVVRFVLLLVPLLANTFFYYMYMNTTFGYMAIILLICLPFVYPSIGRCMDEVSSEE